MLTSNLASPAHFPYVKPELLDWQRRRQTLLTEIKQLSIETPPPPLQTSLAVEQPLLPKEPKLPDLLCLEELSNYWDFFKPELGSLGYDSVYVKRPSVHGTSWSGVEKHDGCGIFFMKDRFRLVHEHSINFQDMHDRVALLLLLEDLAAKVGEEGKRSLLLVANTHLYWDPKQVEDQLNELKQVEIGIFNMKQMVKNTYGQSSLPIILCGDFNNSPSSKIYAYMQNSFLKECNIKFRSAYDTYGLLQKEKQHSPESDEENSSDTSKGFINNEPQHTTVTSRRKETIDYIWYSEDLLRPTHLLEIPAEDVLRKEEGPEGWLAREYERRVQQAEKEGKEKGEVEPQLSTNLNGIPNSVFGSDHLPIAAIFDLQI